MAITVKDLAKMIDHSLLHPTMTDEIIQEGCELAKKYDAASVCLKPYSVKAAKEYLAGSDVMVGSVIGFPHGNSTTAMKVLETNQACTDGAVEIDMVINIGKALQGDFEFVKEEISQINETAIAGGAILKVIFENDYLSEDIIEKLCEVCNEVDVAFVKTSSGYGFVKQDNGFYSYKGATAPHLKLMRRVTNDHIEVKAAGGVRTLRDLLYVRSLGVTRIGATATAVILDEAAEVLASGRTLEEITPTDAEIGGGY
ncbi:MAG: deoxyribose-phosphate aldolase [Lentisphaeraceae bacterium]|nr:deoxyribose-phosphate aldolase [Lentisphaeraceae bacterium]